MKKVVALVFLLPLLQAMALAQGYTVGTYNLRYDNPKDTGNEWSRRLPAVASLIRFHDFDILGTQEGLYHQLSGLDSLLPHVFVGIGRSDGLRGGEHSAIFYKGDKFILLQKGDFWLSPTPQEPGPGWDARIPRICSWVQLKDRKEGATFFVFNAHFDHQGVEARRESSKLILQKITSIAGRSPVIFMGDLNAGQEEEPYLILARSGVLKDAHGLVKDPYVLNGTFNGFDSKKVGTDRIDHIFLSSHFSVGRFGVLTDSYGGRYPSDHFPVLATVAFKKP